MPPTLTVNEQLLAEIRGRGTSRKTPFGRGVLPALPFVKSVQECSGLPACYRYAATRTESWDDILRKSANRLTYSNEDMVLEQVLWEKEPNVTTRQIDVGDEQIELPKNTLMVFRHVLTTPRKDRDGDILRTEGAEVDPAMPLLWQHIPTLPIGKMLSIPEHNQNRLVLVSAIIGDSRADSELSKLARDAAILFENGVLRFSHGFRALEFERMKEGGFDITKFEIMEASGVSIPSNVDAEIEEILLSLIDGGKLVHPLIKEQGRAIREHRPTTVPVNLDVTVTVNGKGTDADKPADSPAKGKCGCGGAGASKQEDANNPTEGSAASQEPESEKRHGPLMGSWEWIEMRLRHQAGRYLALTGSVPMSNRFAWLAGTFADHAIICAESHEVGGPDEFLYFQASWEIEGDEPRFTGEPVAVNLVTTAEIRARSPLAAAKLPDEDKAGRVLSQANLRKLTDVREDLVEMSGMTSMPRAAGAMCERCIGKLDQVIEAASPREESAAGEVTVRQAMGVLLAEATAEERQHLVEALRTLEETEKADQVEQDFLALTGAD